MKENSNLENINKNIEKQLYNKDNKDLNNKKDLDKLKNTITNLDFKYQRAVGLSVLEFLNKTSFNNGEEIKNNFLNNKQKIKKNIDGFINKESAMQLFENESDRISRYNDYKIAESYIPQVSLCLDLFTDCILAPDDFTKESLNFSYKKVLLNSGEDLNDELIKRIEKINEIYKLDEKARTIIRDTLCI